jgi:hypothetical protein
VGAGRELPQPNLQQGALTKTNLQRTPSEVNAMARSQGKLSDKIKTISRDCQMHSEPHTCLKQHIAKLEHEKQLTHDEIGAVEEAVKCLLIMYQIPEPE